MKAAKQVREISREKRILKQDSDETNAPSHRPGELLVKYKQGVSKKDGNKALRERGAKKIKGVKVAKKALAKMANLFPC